MKRAPAVDDVDDDRRLPVLVRTAHAADPLLHAAEVATRRSHDQRVKPGGVQPFVRERCSHDHVNRAGSHAFNDCGALPRLDLADKRHRITTGSAQPRGKLSRMGHKLNQEQHAPTLLDKDPGLCRYATVPPVMLCQRSIPLVGFCPIHGDVRRTPCPDVGREHAARVLQDSRVDLRHGLAQVPMQDRRQPVRPLGRRCQADPHAGR